MLTDRSARLLNLTDYGFAVGRPADIVIVNAESPEQAIAEIAQPLAVFKHGRQTVVWNPPQLLRPGCPPHGFLREEGPANPSGRHREAMTRVNVRFGGSC